MFQPCDYGPCTRFDVPAIIEKIRYLFCRGCRAARDSCEQKAWHDHLL